MRAEILPGLSPASAELLVIERCLQCVQRDESPRSVA